MFNTEMRDHPNTYLVFSPWQEASTIVRLSYENQGHQYFLCN